jgi:hypothetical protein
MRNRVSPLLGSPGRRRPITGRLPRDPRPRGATDGAVRRQDHRAAVPASDRCCRFPRDLGRDKLSALQLQGIADAAAAIHSGAQRGGGVAVSTAQRSMRGSAPTPRPSRIRYESSGRLPSTAAGRWWRSTPTPASAVPKDDPNVPASIRC